jgi:hypothetical protein
MMSNLELPPTLLNEEELRREIDRERTAIDERQALENKENNPHD